MPRSNAPTAQPHQQRDLRPLRSEEHTSELQSQSNLVCRLLLEKKKTNVFRSTSGRSAANDWELMGGVDLFRGREIRNGARPGPEQSVCMQERCESRGVVTT